MKRLLAVLSICAGIVSAVAIAPWNSAFASNLGAFPATFVYGSGAPALTCSATSYNGTFYGDTASLNVYLCSNGTSGGYAWRQVGGAGSGTAGQIQMVGGTAGSFAASHVTDNGTTVTSTEQVAAPSVATGTPSAGTLAALPTGAHGLACDESTTAGVPVAGTDYLRCNATTHQMMLSVNGGGEVALGSGTGTVTTTGSPNSGDIAAFSGPTSVTTATSTQVNTLIKTLTGCNTATYLYSPQSGTCVAPSGGTSGLTQIAQQTLASPAASVTFSAIAGTYTNLVVVINGQSSSASGDFAAMQFNGDTSTNYDFVGIQNITTSGVAAFSTVAGSSIFAANLPQSSVTSRSGNGRCTIESYASTSFFKGGTCNTGFWDTSISNIMQITTAAFDWKNTGAITSILIKLNSGSNFTTGSQFTLYGEQ